MTKNLSRNRRTSGRVTLADVAKEVGVGQMTVSRALRTPEMVSEPLRKQIEQAVERLGYVPNFSARQLASATSQNLVIVTSSITSTENTLILAALRKSLAALELQMVILIADNQQWLRELINHAPQAIVLLNFDCPQEARTWIAKSEIPTVEIGSIQPQPAPISIGIDSKQAMQMMVAFLLSKGYREIGLLCAKQDLAIFKPYLASWHTTLLANHLNPHLLLHSAEDIAFSTGGHLFNEALLTWGKIDALVFLSDELACGALYEAHRRHISVPNDIAIVSLGGLDVGAVSYPRLTTISIPYEKMGKLAGQCLQKVLQGEELSDAEKRIEIPFELTVRDSA